LNGGTKISPFNTQEDVMALQLGNSGQSQRMDMKQFMKEKFNKIEESYTILLINRIKAEKDFKLLEEKILRHEGALGYLKRHLEEWHLYEGDTARLRKVEEANRIRVQEQNEEIKRQSEEIKKSKSGRKKKQVPKY